MAFTLEFSSEKDLDETINLLRKKHGVTGEMHIMPLDSGGWRLQVYSEKKLRDSLLENLKGRRTDQT